MSAGPVYETQHTASHRDACSARLIGGIRLRIRAAMDVSSLFMLFTPLDGWRRPGQKPRTLVALMASCDLKTPWSTATLTDDRIVLVMDNLNRAHQGVPILKAEMASGAIYRRSKPAPGHRIFPYLLKGVEVNRVDQVCRGHHLHPHGDTWWSMDWHSRHVLAWKLCPSTPWTPLLAALEESTPGDIQHRPGESSS